MSRCNVYGKVTTENRSVGIGGRGAQDWVRVSLNTDNAKQTDCNLTVFAEVSGEGLRSKDRRKKGSDKRSTSFEVKFPEDPKGWRADLFAPEESLEQILWNGVPLSILWAAYQKERRG